MVIEASWRAKQTGGGRTQPPAHSWSANRIEDIEATVLRPVMPELIGKLEGVPSVVPPAEAPQATPQAFQLGTLLDDRLRLRVPMEIEIDLESGFYIAKCDEFNEFGYGHDPMSAVDDLRVTLAELYWTLKEEADNLAQHLAQMWTRLRGVVEER